MRRKKGFTLIELLSVMVVLGIILVIAIPNITNMLDDAKKNAFADDAQMVIKTIQTERVPKNIDVSNIDVNIIKTDFGMNNDNYESLSAYMNGNDIYITILGKNKWAGLKATGTIGNMQVVEAGSQQMLGYIAEVITFEYTSATTRVPMVNYSNGCDDCYGEIDLGFNIKFGDKSYSIIYPGSNGIIAFDGYYAKDSGYISFRNDGYFEPVIAPYWADMVIDEEKDSNSGIFYSIGTEDNKKFVLVEYRGMYNYYHNLEVNETADFEIKIYEDGTMKMFYLDTSFGDYVDGNGGDALVGISLNDLNYNQYSYSEKNITNNLGLIFKPSLISLAAKTLAAEECFQFDSTTGTITDYDSSNENCPLSLIIPSEINGVSVQHIGSNAFKIKGLFSVTIPDSVTSIGETAFLTNKLLDVVLPNNLTSIEPNTFMDNHLTSVVIPNGVTSIGDAAFLENQLTNVVIPNGVTSIGSSAFFNNQLTNVIIPNGVTSIGDAAFKNNLITDLSIPNTVTFIGTGAFTDNELPDNQAFIYARNGDGSIDNSKLVSYGGANRDNVIIPNGVTSIGPCTFYDSQLINVVIPNSVIDIDVSAFSSNLLTSITIPNSVINIGLDAFKDNPLTTVTIDNTVGSVTIGSNAFGSVTPTYLR